MRIGGMWVVLNGAISLVFVALAYHREKETKDDFRKIDTVIRVTYVFWLVLITGETKCKRKVWYFQTVKRSRNIGTDEITIGHPTVLRSNNYVH